MSATVSKLFKTEVQLSGNLLNNKEANAFVERIDVLGSVRFAATIICKADTDLLLLVADTALRHKLSGRGEVADELLESMKECYLKRRNENLISRLSFLSRRPNAGSQVGLLKFLKDLHDHLRRPGEFALVNDAGLPYPSTMDHGLLNTVLSRP